MSQLVLTPVGTFSVFGYETPIPYPFGSERTGYLVTDMDFGHASCSCERRGHSRQSVQGSDWPRCDHPMAGWRQHTTLLAYRRAVVCDLQSIPENRVYVSAYAVKAFVASFMAFSHGEVISDDAHAPGIEIGRPTDTYRRIRVQSKFGKLTVLVTDGHLPYPYGREITGYEVADLSDTLSKAKAAGVAVLVDPYQADGRNAAMVQFPGGYIAEIHSLISKQN